MLVLLSYLVDINVVLVTKYYIYFEEFLYPIKCRISATKRKVLYLKLCYWIIVTCVIWMWPVVTVRTYMYGVGGLSPSFLLFCIFTKVAEHSKP